MGSTGHADQKQCSRVRPRQRTGAGLYTTVSAYQPDVDHETKMSKRPDVVAFTFNLSIGRQGQEGLCEFRDHTERDPVSD